MDPITFSGVVSFGIKLVLALGLTKEVVTPLLVSAFGIVNINPVLLKAESASINSSICFSLVLFSKVTGWNVISKFLSLNLKLIDY